MSSQKTNNMQIEKINLATFEVVSNKLLIKQDPAYDVVLVDGPEGKKVEIKLISFDEHAVNHFSISGTVIKKPKNTFFCNIEQEMCQLELASQIQASLQVDGEHPYDIGDKVYYNYNVQLSAQEEYRVVETEVYGICLLISMDSVFGYMKDGKLIPVNGYVFFKRDEKEAEYTTDSGLTVVQQVKGYDTNIGTITALSEPVKAYLDGGDSGDLGIKIGDRVLIDKRFGYKMAYDLHAGDIKNVEVCYQKYLLAIIEEKAA